MDLSTLPAPNLTSKRSFTKLQTMDLYTLGTPNGHKISICLEELGIPYNVKKIDISKGEQFTPEFLKINPNGKIPAIVDDGQPLFESVAILIYLAEKYGKFLPKDPVGRYQTLQWAVFQAAGVGPMFGQFGHFTKYAPEKVPYAIERYSKETNRLMGVMDGQLGRHRYLAGEEYTIADIATWPWVRSYMTGYGQTIDWAKFPNLKRWFDEINARPAVQRGICVP